jgi:hypothetical protein
MVSQFLLAYDISSRSRTAAYEIYGYVVALGANSAFFVQVDGRTSAAMKESQVPPSARSRNILKRIAGDPHTNVHEQKRLRVASTPSTVSTLSTSLDSTVSTAS